jgi:hypothetical protein
MSNLYEKYNKIGRKPYKMEQKCLIYVGNLQIAGKAPAFFYMPRNVYIFNILSVPRKKPSVFLSSP